MYLDLLGEHLALEGFCNFKSIFVDDFPGVGFRYLSPPKAPRGRSLQNTVWLTRVTTNIRTVNMFTMTKATKTIKCISIPNCKCCRFFPRGSVSTKINTDFNTMVIQDFEQIRTPPHSGQPRVLNRHINVQINTTLYNNNGTFKEQVSQGYFCLILVIKVRQTVWVIFAAHWPTRATKFSSTSSGER